MIFPQQKTMLGCSQNTTSTANATAVVAAEVRPSPGISSPPRAVVLSPCAACKILRRRCIEGCVLAPYFPPTEPLKFAAAHRVFGASNIIKLLQELPDDQREDAVNSMVYEADARLRDPVYGCTGAICQLQRQVSELQAELAKAKAEMVSIQSSNSSLFQLICSGPKINYQEMVLPPVYCDDLVMDDSVLDVSWETLWT